MAFKKNQQAQLAFSFSLKEIKNKRLIAALYQAAAA